VVGMEFFWVGRVERGRRKGRGEGKRGMWTVDCGLWTVADGFRSGRIEQQMDRLARRNRGKSRRGRELRKHHGINNKVKAWRVQMVSPRVQVRKDKTQISRLLLLPENLGRVELSETCSIRVREWGFWCDKGIRY
jgi:hypothetical protein